MPRISNIYSVPLGTDGIPDQTIESAKYNTYIHDVEEDLNRPRPISAGGTGADDADEALSNLGAEKSTQAVTNYDNHVFYPGSFYSLVGATGAPPAPAGQTAAHAFVGWVVSSDPPANPPANKNVVVHARDQNDAKVPGTVYVREKKVDATHPSGLWGPWAIDGGGIASATPPLTPADGTLWWDTESGQLYVWYRDVDSAAWVIASPSPDPELFLMKAGDTMNGQLVLSGPPVNDMDAVNKAYVDELGDTITDTILPALDEKVDIAGDTMSGDLKIDKSAPTLTLNKHSASEVSRIVGSHVDFPRWSIDLGDVTAEGTGNAGSNFRISRYNDAGTLIDNPLVIARSDSTSFFGGSINCNGGMGVVGNIAAAGLSLHNYAYFQSDPSSSYLAMNSGCLFGYDKASGNLIWHVANTQQVYFWYGSPSVFQIVGLAYKPGGGPWTDVSDARIKNVSGDYTLGLAEVAQLRPVSYTFKGNDTVEAPGAGETVPYPKSPHNDAATRQAKFVGLVAQEVESIFPDMVTKRNAYIDGAAVIDMRDIDTTSLIYALINSIKELKARVEALEGA